MYYHFKIHKNTKPYWAECVELSGCVTQADSLDDLNENMEEVLNLFLDEHNDSTILFSLPKDGISGRNIVKVAVEPNVAFSFLLRQKRLKNKMTQKQVAKKLGLKSLYSYQRLESSRNANPALSTIAKLKKVFPDFSVDKILQIN